MLQVEQLDKLRMRLGIGKKGAGRGAWVWPVEEIGIIFAQFLLKKFLLPGKADHTQVRRQAAFAGTHQCQISAQERCQHIQACAGLAENAPGLAGIHGQIVDHKAASLQPAQAKKHLLF